MHAHHGRRWRWIGFALGLAVAACDLGIALALEMDFVVSGRDATGWVAAYLAGTFGALGYLIGWLVEARGRERRAASTLDAVRARLAQHEKLATLGVLSATIAHEVRTPLAIIRSSVQSLAEGLDPDDAEAAEACGFAIAEIDRLTRVTTAQLSFARPLVPSPRAVPVGELFEHCALLARRVLAERSLRLARELPDGLPALRVDPDLTLQLVLGLLVNAAAAAPAGSDVTLAARPAGETVELSVADAGPGVPAEAREQIFEPFFTTRAEGTGLGLSVARRIARAHGGELEVGERPGGGARFAVRLPAVSA